jgi:hypothetical protein
MLCANFRNSEAFEAVMLDWFEFLGERPGEVVIMDGGSDRKTHEIYFDLLGQGLIDKLQLIRPDHPDNNKETCYIQEIYVGQFASKPYLLFWKSDTLPYRRGSDGWLVDAIRWLERDDTFAIGGSYNVPARHHDAWTDDTGGEWFFSDQCSVNFCLMKRESFVAATEEYAGEFIRSGFRTENPGKGTGYERYIIETSFERYMRRHNKFVLSRVEDDHWSVFHTNAAGQRLAELREKYRKRIDVRRYFNAGNIVPLNGGSFYGKDHDRIAEARVALGRWKRLALNKLTGRPTGLPQRTWEDRFGKHGSDRARGAFSSPAVNATSREGRP